MKKGDKLQLTKAGLDCLCGGSDQERQRLSNLRFEFRKQNTKIESITVKRWGKTTYEHYHYAFLELVSI